MTAPQINVGWQDDNLRVQDARRPFTRRLHEVLQVDGVKLTAGLPSDQRITAGIDAQSFYTFPLLFYAYFPEITLRQLNALCVCGSYLFDYVLCLDKLLDRARSGDAGTLLATSMCQRQGLALLGALFPPGSRFWGHLDRYEAHFAQALVRERVHHHCLVTPYSTEALEFIYSGKPAMGKAALAALGVAAGREDLIEPLTRSHDAFHVAFQLIDDLQDWRIDYASQQYSYPLTHALHAAGWARRAESEARPTVEELAEIIERPEVVAHVRDLARFYLTRAEELLGGLPESDWLAALRKTRLGLERLRPGARPPAHGAPSATHAALEWQAADRAALPLPCAPSWKAELDARRQAGVGAADLRALQHACLLSAERAANLAEALCHVGWAIARSRRRFPERALSEHLGLSAGELEWCRRNDSWLQGLLASSLDQPACLWTADDARCESTGWMPLAIGRYLGHRLVEDYPAQLDPEQPCDERQTGALIDHYRQQLIA